jgi:hypothetical protein
MHSIIAPRSLKPRLLMRLALLGLCLVTSGCVTGIQSVADIAALAMKMPAEWREQLESGNKAALEAALLLHYADDRNSAEVTEVHVNDWKVLSADKERVVLRTSIKLRYEPNIVVGPMIVLKPRPKLDMEDVIVTITFD